MAFLHRVAAHIRDLSVLRTILVKEGNGINVYQLNDYQMLEVLADRLLYDKIKVECTSKSRQLSTTGIVPESPQYMTPQEVEQIEKTRRGERRSISNATSVSEPTSVASAGTVATTTIMNMASTGSGGGSSGSSSSSGREDTTSRVEVAVASTAAHVVMMSSTGSGGGGSGSSSSSGDGSPRLRPEKKYYGSKKHGIEWTEGPATARSTGKPQGQWGGEADLNFAAERASTLKPGEGGWFDLPEDHSSVVYMPNGETIPATRIWVRNNGTGTFHGYPAP